MELQTKDTHTEVSKKKVEGNLVKLQLREIKAYEKNAKIHTPEQVGKIRESIQAFGYKDFIAVDENNIILEGHGRLQALYQIDSTGTKKISVIKITDLNESEKKAYRIAHNKIGMDTGFDEEILSREFNDLEDTDAFEDTGFSRSEITEIWDREKPSESEYTKKIDIPTYTPSDTKPDYPELYSNENTNKLIEEIEAMDIDNKEKEFLKLTASRLVVFNYDKIADFYAHSDKNTQAVMEKMALVIIDYDKAIENGFVRLSEDIAKQYLQES